MSKLNEVIKKSNSRFENLVIEVVLKSISVEGETVTLSFYCEYDKSYYSKRYNTEENKGVIDFNRVMNSLGSYKDNYELWLRELIARETPIEIGINSSGYIRYVKRLPQEVKDLITKTLILRNIQGLNDDDYKWLMSLPVEQLAREFK